MENPVAFQDAKNSLLELAMAEPLETQGRNNRIVSPTLDINDFYLWPFEQFCNVGGNLGGISRLLKFRELLHHFVPEVVRETSIDNDGSKVPTSNTTFHGGTLNARLPCLLCWAANSGGSSGTNT